jgi:hypothetical protein
LWLNIEKSTQEISRNNLKHKSNTIWHYSMTMDTNILALLCDSYFLRILTNRVSKSLHHQGGNDVKSFPDDRDRKDLQNILLLLHINFTDCLRRFHCNKKLSECNIYTGTYRKQFEKMYHNSNVILKYYLLHCIYTLYTHLYER